ncbi:putative transcriptional regulatory protein for hcr operon [Magnetospirillum sp. LM-5]|uniref:MarR family winged helix-turn-helix transcriptional regulator n=1 Tax=Magnetospirillum sp. LM-5 TaxID=2681466 RepID=UPI00137EA447|nr:MarR family transcriptional regulator [Magnetospirillum sp. LM-5]CAA7616812.1 putative transcriptional regulatory protein for hcr operon [Magnetospirillum sp. LM-5]
MTARRKPAIIETGSLSYGMLPGLLGFHLRRAQVSLFKHFARTVGQVAGITPGLFGMLQVIAANPGLAQSRLAEAMEVERSTIVKVVDQLEARGLIVREPSAVDRRSHCLELTELGRSELARMEQLVLAHEAELAARLTPEDRQELTRLLIQLAD